MSMMNSPEAVRGCWYRLAPPVDDDVTRDQADELLSFGVDGHFARYEINSDDKTEAENGDYTFDGDFLILRARRTHTFRVHRKSFWRWDLEGKKNSWVLMRGFAPEGDIDELPEEESRDIRLIPVRARVESDFDGHDDIYRLIYEQGERDRRCLATFSVDSGPRNHLWVGISPFVRGLSLRTWTRIIDESYLDAFLDGNDRPEQVVVELLSSGESASLDEQ